MKIRALCTLRGDEGTIRRNAEAVVSNAYGKELIKRGRAVAVDAPRVRKTTKSKGAAAPSEGE